ncbi:MAG: hypothetical protein RML36_08805 [Anaerolineae bacterium]|nr:hypothetical protein [Anaerolineae bacterium]
MAANLRIKPTPPAATRLMRWPLGRQRMKVVLWRRQGRLEGQRARRSATGCGREERPMGMGGRKVSPRPLIPGLRDATANPADERLGRGRVISLV